MANTILPPALSATIHPFRCPLDKWTTPSRTDVMAPAQAWVMVSMLIQTLRPGAQRVTIELTQGKL